MAAADKSSGICCPRCNAALQAAPPETMVDSSVFQSVDNPANPLEGAWELEHDLSQVTRILKTWKASGKVEPAEVDPQRVFHPAHAGVPQPLPAHSAARPAATKKQGNILAWLFLSLGVMAFVFGGVLLGWSFFMDRSDLWTIGLPLTLIGQAGLLIGFMFQLENVSHNNQQTKSTLEELDEQLDELRHATTMLGTTKSDSARSFYVHLAEGASPQMLLADLKGQLDMLAVRMSHDRK